MGRKFLELVSDALFMAGWVLVASGLVMLVWGGGRRWVSSPVKAAARVSVYEVLGVDGVVPPPGGPGRVK